MSLSGCHKYIHYPKCLIVLSYHRNSKPPWPLYAFSDFHIQCDNAFVPFRISDSINSVRGLQNKKWNNKKEKF